MLRGWDGEREGDGRRRSMCVDAADRIMTAL